MYHKCTLMHHVRSPVDDSYNERRHVSERVGLSYEPLSVIGCSGFEGVITSSRCVNVGLCLYEMYTAVTRM